MTSLTPSTEIVPKRDYDVLGPSGPSSANQLPFQDILADERRVFVGT